MAQFSMEIMRLTGSVPRGNQQPGTNETIFGTWKLSYGLRRMRWRGLAKAAMQIRLTAIAYNIKRTLKIVAAAARQATTRPPIGRRLTADVAIPATAHFLRPG
ncbi:transposase [Ensifer sp. ENS07]|uniref:transposase n=1 Tax=Ensifer sp. ENS07 TaxID=2769274 RepID=UPI001FEFA586|nr:transposase [Ensifer sp. ENS07]